MNKTLSPVWIISLFVCCHLEIVGSEFLLGQKEYVQLSVEKVIYKNEKQDMDKNTIEIFS